MNNFYNLNKMITKHIPQNKYQKYSLEKLYQKKKTYDFFFTNKIKRKNIFFENIDKKIIKNKIIFDNNIYTPQFISKNINLEIININEKIHEKIKHFYDFEYIFKGTNVLYLDPSNEITQIPNWSVDFYLDDGHMSVTGNKCLADYIFRNIFENLNFK